MNRKLKDDKPAHKKQALKTLRKEPLLDPPEIFRENPNASRLSINVSFKSNLSSEQVVAEISSLEAPQVVFWYIGCYGLKKEGVKFYKEAFLSYLLQANSSSICWLFDLTAWAAFKYPQCSIEQISSCCDPLSNLHSRVKCLTSSEIFRKMAQISNPAIIDYLRNALRRDFIKKRSKDFLPTNIYVNEIFPKGCPVMADWYNHDVSKAYSSFQYLEGCLIAQEIISRLSTKNWPNPIHIVFALPNDELKYYKDSLNSFEKDLSFLITQFFPNLASNHISISILGFRYGHHISNRPYNAPSSSLRKNQVTSDLIFGPHRKRSLSEVHRGFTKHEV